MVFEFYQPDGKSILPRSELKIFQGINTEAGGMVYHDGLFHLFFNVLQDYPPTQAAIGYATSPDGYHWSILSDRSILTAADVRYADNVVLASDALVEEDGTWVLYFHTTSKSPSTTGARIGCATAPSPNGPWSVTGLPLLEPSESGWDEFEVKYPNVIKTGQGYFMYYQGLDRFGGTVRFGLATSQDGLHWEKHPDPIFTADNVPWGEFNSIRYPYVVHTEAGWLLFFRAEGDAYPMAYGLAVSPDGINWAAAQDVPVIDIKKIPGWTLAFAPEVEYSGGKYFFYVQMVSNGGKGYLNLLTFDGDLLPGVNLAALPPAAPYIDSHNVPMILVPAGEFLMGSDHAEDDAPPHLVYLDTYSIDRHEVTYDQFLGFLDEAGNQLRNGIYWFNTGLNDKVTQVDGQWQVEEGFEDYPVIGVSWFAAEAFCAWRGGRLPTEAEWEKAARGPEGISPFPWGKDINCEIANYDKCEWGAPLPVETFPGNISYYGVYDLAGNVAEFTADWYAPDYYSLSPYENPTGPEESPIDVVASRGGSFYSTLQYLRVYQRVSEFHRYETFQNVGFRCAATP